MNTAGDTIRDSYKSISAPTEGLFKDNGSRFIAHAYTDETGEEIKDIVAALRKEYHDARHHCYAWRLGHLGDRYRANDDGEPSGSSGRPILGQIDSRGLSDVLVVVTRYFGGIKLGIPGLVRAYRTSTADALDKAVTIEKTASRRFRLDFGYMSMNDVMKMVKDLGLTPCNQGYGMECSMEVAVRLSMEEEFMRRVSGIGGCSATDTHSSTAKGTAQTDGMTNDTIRLQ